MDFEPQAVAQAVAEKPGEGALLDDVACSGVRVDSAHAGPDGL